MDEKEVFEQGVLWGAAVVGGLCGLLPLLVGSSKGKSYIGLIWFFICLLSGLKFGIIGALPAAIFGTVIAVVSAGGSSK